MRARRGQHRAMSNRCVSLIAGLAFVACVPAGASGSTFSGRCVGSGLVRTGAPLRVAPVVTSISFASTGTCTGMLDGRAIQNAEYAGLSVSPSALLSCASGTASGDTTVSIRGDAGWTTLHMHFDDLNVVGTSGFLMRGASGGLGVGQHQLTPDPAMALGCLGAGISEVGNTVSLATLTPLQG